MGRRFVLAPDSFKESLTAKEVCEAMEAGIRRAIPDAECIRVPMADGGEGTAQSLVDATGGTWVNLTVTGPLATPVAARYGILGNGRTGVIEMASASGIQGMPREHRNPLAATTEGTGELIRDGLERGLTDFIVGVGGSATNDGGAGMAQALGYRFLDRNGRELPPGGGFLNRLDRIDADGVLLRLRQAKIRIASDVTNPLCGEQGASAVFGPQKGATPEMVELLDRNLRHFGEVVRRDLGVDILGMAGAGAGGGLGGGLLAFANAEMGSGVELVIEYTGLRERLRAADCCFTGEGRIDGQTRFGKAPWGVAREAKRVNPDIRVVALAGSVGPDAELLYAEGFDAVFGIAPGASDLDALLAEGRANIARTAESIARLLR